MVGRVNISRIKARKSYSVEELADVCKVSISTVRTWLKSGMSRMDATTPTMILGWQAKDYLSRRKEKSKRPLAIGEFYCMRCKAPRQALGGMADYHPTSDEGGRLKAICERCECNCNRNIRQSDLAAFSEVLEIESRETGED